MNVVLSWSSLLMQICLYPEKASINVSSSCPIVELTNWQILGREKLSFGHAWLRSVKSTHTPFPIWFFYLDDISQPFWVIDFSHETCNHELVYFFHKSFVLLGGEYLSSLLDRLLLWINVQLMLYDTLIYAWHVFMSSSKHIQTFLVVLEASPSTSSTIFNSSIGSFCSSSTI